jgi:hypothetical protein
MTSLCATAKHPEPAEITADFLGITADFLGITADFLG